MVFPNIHTFVFPINLVDIKYILKVNCTWAVFC